MRDTALPWRCVPATLIFTVAWQLDPPEQLRVSSTPFRFTVPSSLANTSRRGGGRDVVVDGAGAPLPGDDGEEAATIDTDWETCAAAR